METSFPCSYIANILLLCLLISVVMLPESMCSVRMQCNERDLHVLLNFKYTVVDPSAFLSSWSDERDCCQWRGVQCDNTTGRVINLTLPCPLEPYADDCGETRSHCLAGELPLSLLQLEFLNYLDLKHNNFHALAHDDYVDITNCNHPHLSCENSSNLLHLDLSSNENLHIDNLRWLSRVPSLRYVDLGGVNLQGKVDWIQLGTMLPFLTELFLDWCKLRNINPSPQYANFTSLEVLSLSCNEFSSEFIPDWLFNLSDLAIIDLSYNYFQGQLPKSLLNLRNVQELYVSNNELSGPTADWLAQLEHLQVLDVGENSFYGPIPSTLGNMSSLAVLDVRSNHLNGSLPESLGQLLNLEDLFLTNNHLTGYVTERNFIELPNLKSLSIGSPGLILDFDLLWVPPYQLDIIHLEYMMGSNLPAWMYKQTSLTRLIIAYSIISFEPQDKFWDFVARVTYLRLEQNTIHGEMSNVLLNSTFINLGSNKFKGKLPQLSPNVMILRMRNNSFQGFISSFLCQKMNGRSRLQYLDMSYNLLSGGLTNCWMHWRSLVIVKLEGNKLTGTIPPSISLLSNLTVLHLNKNNLSGEIPLSLKNCQKLQVLDVGENKLSGFLPNWMMQNAKILRLRSNQLSGNMSLHICQLTSLTILDFADNKISGSLPICLQNMTAMTFPNSYSGVYRFCIRIREDFTIEVKENDVVHIKGQGSDYGENLKFLHSVDLSRNNMSGKIPPEIFSLTELQSLNLSYNQFEGNIPNEIRNMKKLESLDLASNQLSGEIPRDMVELSFLEALNLSFNNFTGKIPTGTQLQGFDPQSFMGNPGLCGAPLPKNCRDKEDHIEPIETNESQEDEFLFYFYIGIGVGFAIAFWGVCIAIFFNKNFRHSYFRFLYRIKDKLDMVVLKRNDFR